MPVPTALSAKGKQKADIPPADQPTITKFFPSTSQEDPSPTKPDIPQTDQSFILHLIDNKTRNTPDVPPPRDRFQSQLQLMLYKRLLSSLIAPTGFASIMARLSLNMHAPFSQQFLHAKKVLCISNDLNERTHEARCMADLSYAWDQAVRELGLGTREGADAGLDAEQTGIEDELELVYRERPGASRSQSSNGNIGKRKGSPSPLDTARDGKRNVAPHSNTNSLTLEAKAAAPNADLDDRFSPPRLAVGNEADASSFAANGHEPDDENTALAWAIQESLKPPSNGTHVQLNGKSDTRGSCHLSPILSYSDTDNTFLCSSGFRRVNDRGHGITNSTRAPIYRVSFDVDGHTSTRTYTHSLPRSCRGAGARHTSLAPGHASIHGLPTTTYSISRT